MVVTTLGYDWSDEVVFFFSSRRRHTRSLRDWSSDVCSSDLVPPVLDDLPAVALDRDQLGPRLDFRVRVAGGLILAGSHFRSPLHRLVLCIKDFLKGVLRSEERRVGKECRSRWVRDG